LKSKLLRNDRRGAVFIAASFRYRMVVRRDNREMNANSECSFASMIGGSQATSWSVNLSSKLYQTPYNKHLRQRYFIARLFLGVSIVSLPESSTRSTKLLYRLVLEPRLQSSRSGNQKYCLQQREVTCPRAGQSVLRISANSLEQTGRLLVSWQVFTGT
jgi:hypothetical protein